MILQCTITYDIHSYNTHPHLSLPPPSLKTFSPNYTSPQISHVEILLMRSPPYEYLGYQMAFTISTEFHSERTLW